MSALVPGYEGNGPIFAPARDIQSKDPLTGQMRRETIPSIQNDNVDRITLLFRRGSINARQCAAANKLQRDWERSQISPCASTLGNAGAGGGRHDFTPSDAKIAAGNAYHAAIVALGRWLSIVHLVALDNLTVTEASKRLGVHNLVGMDRLDAGLEILAAHYQIPIES